MSVINRHFTFAKQKKNQNNFDIKLRFNFHKLLVAKKTKKKNNSNKNNSFLKLLTGNEKTQYFLFYKLANLQ